MAFRGGAKSTITEEAIVIQALLGDFHNCVVLGSNEDRAKDRLRAIKHTFEASDIIRDLFGPQQGTIWEASKITLPNGVMIQALGQGQDLRGIKHLDWRPDLVVVDDLERREDATTPAARKAMRTWFFGELVPAVDPTARFRANGTPLADDSLIVGLSKLPTWRVHHYPIKYKDTLSGEWRATWPDRFPLLAIDKLEQEFIQAGLHDIFLREYMVQATAEDAKAFKEEYFRYASHVRSYEATYAMYDPARTVRETSAHTGKAVWSWRGNKLLVWEASGHFWQPSEIIDDMFEVDRKYNPVFIAVERDGLEEFIMQPLRQEGAKRNSPLPIKDVKAPRGKLDFIRALEPFMKANEVEFAGPPADFTECVQQFLNFPTGRIDIPNALAYAPRLRVGLPMFPDFTDDHVDELTDIPREQFWLALNATPAATAGALVQLVKGRLFIYADWVSEGDPGQTVADIVRSARLRALGRPIKIVLPPQHFRSFDAVGLAPAIRALPAQPLQGGDAHQGRASMRQLFRDRVNGRPAILVDIAANWTLRAFAGGYARPPSRDGTLMDEPVDNHYALLCQALECLTGLASYASPDDEYDNGAKYAYAPDGRRYLSARG